MEQSTCQLDRDEAAARSRPQGERIPADIAVQYVRSLPETSRKAEGGKGRQLLASALFDRIDVLGLREGDGPPERTRGPARAGSGRGWLEYP